MSGYAGEYFRLLSEFDQKANPQPQSDNTQIQKVAAPTDTATLSDTQTTTVTPLTAMTWGSAKYDMAEWQS